MSQNPVANNSYYSNALQPRPKDFAEDNLMNQTILVKLVRH